MENKYLTLVHVAINPYTRQSKNEMVIFRQDSPATFSIQVGATDCHHGKKKFRSITFPMSDWDDQVDFYQRKGFTVTDDKDRGTVEVSVEGKTKPIKDKTFQTILKQLIELNNEQFEENYSKSIRSIAPEAIDKVQNALFDLAKEQDEITVKEFNDVLLHTVWTFVPRQMNNLDAKVAHRKTDFVKIIDREQELLDLLNQELKNGNVTSTKQDILEQNHLSERPVTKEEETMIKKLMTDQANRFEKAWYLENEEVRAKMDAFCKANHLGEDDVTWLFHGTRPENIWSIEKNGLYLNPAVLKSGVHITGKAYGYGIYTAPYCYKSMAYASSNFGGGRHASGFLLLCRVATGKPYYINRDPHPTRPNHYVDFHKNHPDCHCCWAEAGQTASLDMMRLRWDEVVVYREDQIVPVYLIQYSA